jgi:stage II sporulation protein AA (anti-sigma F factor antagonist)
MGVRIENTPQKMIAWISGEIDHHTARQIREQVDNAVEMLKPKHLCLDFSDVGFMDSSGIGLIMGRHRLIQLYGGTLEVVNASERIGKVIRLAGLDRLNIFKEAEEANAGGR